MVNNENIIKGLSCEIAVLNCTGQRSFSRSYFFLNPDIKLAISHITQKTLKLYNTIRNLLILVVVSWNNVSQKELQNIWGSSEHCFSWTAFKT